MFEPEALKGESCEFCEDVSNVGTQLEMGPAGLGMVHTACHKKRVKKTIISEILSWYPDRDPTDYDGLAATLHNDAWKQGVIISLDEARIAVINAFRERESNSNTEKGTQRKLLNISRNILREKYAEPQTTPSLDSQFVQLRQNHDNQDVEPEKQVVKTLRQFDEKQPYQNTIVTTKGAVSGMERKAYNDAVELKAWLRENGFLFGESLEATKVYFGDEWPDIIEDFERWRVNMERCYIIIRNKKEGDKKGIIAQCQTRFSPKQKKIIRWRMEQFGQKVQKGGFRFGLEVTLTMDPKKFGNLWAVGEQYKVFIEKFMDFANMRLRRAGKKSTTCYLKACELTDSGLLHTHIGFYGPGITGKIKKEYANGKTVTDYIFPQKDIADLWAKYGIGEIAWVKRKPVTEAVDYVTKHVAKSWGSEGNLMLEAFLHYTGLRQWSSSRGAVPKEPPSVERWECMGVAISPGEAFLHREELICSGYVIIRDDLRGFDPPPVGEILS